MSKRKLAPLGIALLALAIVGCIGVWIIIEVEIISWIETTYWWFIHYPDCTWILYEYTIIEIVNYEYIYVEVYIEEIFGWPGAERFTGTLLAGSYAELTIQNPVGLGPDPVVCSSDLTGSVTGIYDFNYGDHELNFQFDGYSDCVVAHDDTHGDVVLGQFALQDTLPPDSMYLNLWLGELYVKSRAKLVHPDLKAYNVDAGVYGSIAFIFEWRANFEWSPTEAEMASYEARSLGDRIEIAWSTTSEIDNAGFYVLRGTSEEGSFDKINDQLIPSRGSELAGADYTFIDRDIDAGAEYFYRIEVVNVEGKTAFTEPFKPDTGTPAAFSLAQNYPNPFNPVTEIMYNLPSACHVRLEVYNVLGQRVATLVNEHQSAGSKVVEWNGKDAVGNAVTSGVYFYKIQAGSFVEMKKMILLR
jgi:hypothetical protein